MNILLGVHHYPPQYHGGAEREVKRLASSFLERGHAVRVVCVERIDDGPSDGVAWSDEVYEGVAVRRLSMDLRRAPDRVRWEYDNPWLGQHFRTLFNEFRPDVFMLTGGYLLTASPLVAARESGIPTIVRLSDFWFLCPRITLMRSDGSLSRVPVPPAECARCLGEERRRYRIPGRLFPSLMRAYWRLQRSSAERVRRRSDALRRALNAVDAAFSPSQFLRKNYLAAGFDATRIHFMRQGLELPAKMPAPEPPPPLRLCYLGQIAPLKGVDVLLRAARALPGESLELRVYGSLDTHPAYAEELRALAAGDVRIQLCGPYRHGLAAALAGLHAVVVPSVWYENSPNAILEPFAHGIPVIASDLGGMAELVRHEESGLLFPAGDATGLARQIGRLLHEPSLLPLLRSGVPPMKSAAEEVDELEAWCRRVVSRRTPLSVEEPG